MWVNPKGFVKLNWVGFSRIQETGIISTCTPHGFFSFSLAGRKNDISTNTLDFRSMYLSTVAPRLFNPSPLIKMPTYPPSIPPFHRALFFNNYFTNTPHQHNYSPKTLSQSHMLPHTLAPSSKSAPCNTWMQLCPSLVT